MEKKRTRRRVNTDSAGQVSADDKQKTAKKQNRKCINRPEKRGETQTRVKKKQLHFTMVTKDTLDTSLSLASRLSASSGSVRLAWLP